MVGGTLASSITKTGHHDIAKILLKVALSTINQIKSLKFGCYFEPIDIELLAQTKQPKFYN
jgi:hypothetical protein